MLLLCATAIQEKGKQSSSHTQPCKRLLGSSGAGYLVVLWQGFQRQSPPDSTHQRAPKPVQLAATRYMSYMLSCAEQHTPGEDQCFKTPTTKCSRHMAPLSQISSWEILQDSRGTRWPVKPCCRIARMKKGPWHNSQRAFDTSEGQKQRKGQRLELQPRLPGLSGRLKDIPMPGASKVWTGRLIA